MKNNKLLAILVLSTLMIACKDEEKTTISKYNIDSSQLRQSYDINESIPLQLAGTESAAIDSVVYFINEKRIGSIKGDETFNLDLSTQRYGSKNIKAEIHEKGTASQTAIDIEVLPQEAPAVLTYSIVNTYPHDIKAYTQGLEFYGDILIESTGNGEGAGTRTKGRSSIRKVNPKTGEIIKIVELPDTVFGEGATVLNDKVYQLTYKNNEVYVYNIETLEQEKRMPYFQSMEGWGLTNDGTNLYVTDGSTQIYKVNPENFQKIDQFTVATNQQVIPSINELEWVDGKIFANLYGMPAICIIEPSSGKIEAVIDLSELRTKVTQHADLDVLNGIAYNKKTDTFFVTGKNWDKMFEIKINR